MEAVLASPQKKLLIGRVVLVGLIGVFCTLAFCLLGEGYAALAAKAVFQTVKPVLDAYAEHRNGTREIYQQGLSSLKYLTAILSATAVGFGLVTCYWAGKLTQLWRDHPDSGARYKAVIDQAPEGIFLVDADSQQILEMNPAFQDLLGYSVSDLFNLTLEDMVATSEAGAISADPAHLPYMGLSDRLAGEHQYRHRDGCLVDVEVVSTFPILYDGRIAYWVIVRDIAERKRVEAALRESEQRLTWQANHDDLTGLVNRQAFERHIQQALSDAQIYQHPYVLGYLDLDQFKIINDIAGHQAGDELLRQITHILRSQIRTTDILARLGGDEFGLLLYHRQSSEAAQIADALRQSIQAFRFAWQDQVFSVGVSIGLVQIDAHSPSLSHLWSAAAAACSIAKNNGRNRVHCYQTTDRQLIERQSEMQWANRITRALEEDRFQLYYQSIVSISASADPGEYYEVLVRMLDEEGNIILPQVFMPAAERYDLMHRIDRWVISTLFSTQSRHYQQVWEHCQKASGKYLYSINLSGASINDDRFINFLFEQFATHHIPPQLICFEITETVAITNLSKAIHFIQLFRQLGCRFALDDFGSGMSSFGYLKNLPVNYLKIDGAFVKDILKDPVHLAMAEAINRVGQVMGLQTIAEFVESDVVLERLRSMGVNYAQGDGIARPRPLQAEKSLRR
ncbi:MAG TPA: EAL domain-containing protein [Coleofasciculaceae cyanobacterium]